MSKRRLRFSIMASYFPNEGSTQLVTDDQIQVPTLQCALTDVPSGILISRSTWGVEWCIAWSALGLGHAGCVVIAVGRAACILSTGTPVIVEIVVQCRVLDETTCTCTMRLSFAIAATAEMNSRTAVSVFMTATPGSNPISLTIEPDQGD
jgi:hypothetical protein